jgi:TPR repeat protein
LVVDETTSGPGERREKRAQREYASSTRGKYDLGCKYYNDEDYVQAVNCWRPLAEEGYAPAQNDLAEAYSSGEGVAKDYTQAFVWYRNAAEHGYAPAMYNEGGLNVLLTPA